MEEVLKFFAMLVAALAIFAAPAFAKGPHHPKHHVRHASSVTTTAQADESASGLKVTRDYDESYQTENWSAVKKAWAKYSKARTAYMESWSIEDVDKASALAPNTPCAAWPYIRLADHLWNTGQRASDEYAAAITKAKDIIGDFKGEAADKIRAIVCNHDGPKGIGPCNKSEEEGSDEDASATDGDAENTN